MYIMRNKYTYDDDDDDGKNLFKKFNSQARLGVAILAHFFRK